MFQSDSGREFDNTSLGDHFLDHGIYFRKSYPDTQAQDGVAKRKHHHLTEMARAFHIETHMPATFWVDAIHTAMFVANRLPNLISKANLLLKNCFKNLPTKIF